jgi:hypothetical protein
VVDFAATFALLQIDDPQMKIAAEVLADRMASCLRHFSDRDAHLARQALARHTGRLVEAGPDVQLAALGQLGDLPAFWATLTLHAIAQTATTSRTTVPRHSRP